MLTVGSQNIWDNFPVLRSEHVCSLITLNCTLYNFLQSLWAALRTFFYFFYFDKWRSIKPRRLIRKSPKNQTATQLNTIRWRRKEKALCFKTSRAILNGLDAGKKKKKNIKLFAAPLKTTATAGIIFDLQEHSWESAEHGMAFLGLTRSWWTWELKKKFKNKSKNSEWKSLKVYERL